MTTTQSALNIGNQNEMINQSYHDTETPPGCTHGIERMLSRHIKEQSCSSIRKWSSNRKWSLGTTSKTNLQLE